MKLRRQHLREYTAKMGVLKGLLHHSGGHSAHGLRRPDVLTRDAAAEPIKTVGVGVPATVNLTE